MTAQLAKANSSNELPPGYRLGEYIIESVLGHGGFGITYLARDTKLSSLVAIKEYFPQAFALRSRQSTIVSKTAGHDYYRWGLREFLKEARALAKFKHNHIVRVLRFLEANGTAYMVMEYEKGESLAQYVRKSGGYLNESKLLSIFLPILNGLQAVHDAGLLHLDIKPDNIYLRTDGQPMLIDFGSARHTKGGSEQDQRVALTPAYAALEHYPNHGKKGPWTDVYSIGATIYRCITATEPLGAMVRYQGFQHKNADPLKPATAFDRPLYASHIRECIDWAISLAPKDRPHTAFALQRGLMGHGMSNEKPVAQSSVNYRSGFIGIAKVSAPKERAKGIRRGLLEKGLIGLVVLATFGIFSLKFLVDSESITTTQLFNGISYMETAAKTIASKTEDGLRRIQGRRPRNDTHKPSVQPQKSPERQRVPVLNAKTLAGALTEHTDEIGSLIFLADDSLLASASPEGVVRFRYVETGSLLRTFAADESSIGAVALSNDGRWLAKTGDKNGISISDINKNSQGTQLSGHKRHIHDIAFSHDGRLLASTSQDQSVILWDLATLEIRREFSELGSTALTVAFSPNGRWIATGHANGEIRYWEVSTGKELTTLKANEEEITAVAFSPDGKWLASGGTENFLKIWTTGVGKRDRTLTGAPDSVNMITFTPDSKSLIASGTDNVMQMWDIETGELNQVTDGQNYMSTNIANDQRAISPELLTGKVVRVVDGDTIYVLDDTNKQRKIALAGIDAPEKDQAYGLAATENLALLVDDKRVVIEYRTGNRYGRLIGKVWLQGVDICLAQIKAGFAWHYKQNGHSAEDVELYADSEIDARAEKFGLWRDNSPTPPWEFRRQHRSR